MKKGNTVETPKTSSPKTSAPARTKGWQRWAPWAITAFFALWILGNLRTPPAKSEFHIDEFGKLPVVLEGRIQPFDSVARNTLLVMRSKQTLAVDPEGDITGLAKVFKTKRMPAIEWLLEAMTRPEQANQRKLFRIDHPELKSLLAIAPEEKHFSYNQLEPKLTALENEAKRIRSIEDAVRTPFEKSVTRLYFAILTFNRLKNSLQPDTATNFAEELARFEQAIPKGVAALKKREAGEDYNPEDLAGLGLFREISRLAQFAYPFVVPPSDPADKDGWKNIGASLMEAVRTAKIEPAAMAYAQMASAYGNNQPDKFNKAVADYQAHLKTTLGHTLVKGSRESFFNHYAFFIKSMTIYIVAFLFACAYWFRWSDWLRATAMRLTALALVVHTVGLIFRMYLEGRPPVTNLYSSAIFVGWGAVGLGLILERIFKDGIGAVVATFIGFLTLVIAHNLSLDGDTLKVLVAVLDTNIWLATHVVIITLGYSAMFLAGILAAVYILRGFFTSTLAATTAKSLTRMVYGIVCFATLFSFIGTVLGGIWADQSWGRFWGWDPKENGALLIVIWCAVILHARWGGLIRERGLMAMAIFGNIVTAFSWFGVNMLGVGLHSYGFMDQAFKWLMAFNVSQIVLIALCLLPVRMWKSFNGGDAGKSKSEPAPTSEQLVAAQKMLPQNPAN